MKRLRHRIGLAPIIIFSVIILLLICLCVIMLFKTGEEASVGIFSLAVTLLGTIFIAIELKNGQHVTCSDMLIDLNNYFHDSDRLMKVYEILEEDELDREKCDRLWSNVKSVEIAQYCTFFENLYLLYKNEIADIADLDDLFGYRFFIFVHNPYIQENYILPTSSSYVQIFKLYQAWIDYRMKSEGTDWKSRVPFRDYMFSNDYLKNKTYMHDCLRSDSRISSDVMVKGKLFSIRELTFRDLSKIMSLQEECIKNLPDPQLYYPLSREEFLESLHLDKAVGVYHQDVLVAVAIIVVNRISTRNIAGDIDCDPCSSLTFDAVMVLPQWRGYGLQKILLEQCLSLAKTKNIKYIAATVSPDNSHSLNNFIRFGFEIVSTSEKYGGLVRHLLKYSLNK